MKLKKLVKPEVRDIYMVWRRNGEEKESKSGRN
jgi:hypothetical protein